MIRTPYKMSNNIVISNSRNWEDLRKQARQIENELDMKLVSFSKLGTGQLKEFQRSEEKESLLGSNSNRMFDTMSLEIERLLLQLTEINDDMSSYLSNMSIGETNGAQLHTMQRHRDILQDYSHEFIKTKANIKASKDREDLLGSVKKDISEYKSGLSRRTDLYLKENDHIRNSDRLADEAIDIAMSTKENLASQRKMFHSMSNRILSLGNRFPQINSLFQKINMRKKRDTIIIAIVFSVCLIILLLYSFR
ncbi:Golgi SNAP receptor complex member 1 [Hydra vulgaris]|uniref:Golgi SNAP receptor complex member 1 n=1 Tax=Hydra vulgaris TaxID=6087 RepID=UPI0001926BD7|nr:Golgi SNAP receptor complex member 1 [Hydra vulgaris]